MTTLIMLFVLWAACITGSGLLFRAANRSAWTGCLLALFLGGLLGLFISLLVFMFGKKPPGPQKPPKGDSGWGVKPHPETGRLPAPPNYPQSPYG
jgi:hypothetical protein